jgi:hypothetical protein
VILLENSNEWNLSLKKKDPKKKGEQGLKRTKEVKPQWKSSMFWEKKRKEREDEIYKILGETLSKERKKGDHNFL